MFKVTSERFETKANLCVLWDTKDITEQYLSEGWHCEDFIFESDSYQQAKLFFDCEKSDCKTFVDYSYLKADIICLYHNDELMECYATPLEK